MNTIWSGINKSSDVVLDERLLLKIVNSNLAIWRDNSLFPL